jgi:ParB family chromosome partitioning protein
MQDVRDIVDLPLEEVWADASFNCRGHVAPIDVIDLSKDIEKHGLQQPISVKSVTDVPPGKKYKYKVITGHRRYTAFRVLKRDTIPCVINNGLSESQALVLNLGENIHRQDLTITQEANALKRLKQVGFTVANIAESLNKSSTWVKIRYMLLELPDAIREAAAAGYINQKQIQEIHRLGDFKKQIEAAKKIKSAKIRGEKSPTILKTKRDMFKRSPRDVDGIFFMQSHIREAVGNSFGTRCLAWAAGEISDLEIYRDIEAQSIELGVNYNIPY